MKKSIFLINIAILLYSIPSFAQGGQWIWKKGSNTASSIGAYGTQGVASPTNEPPARYQCAYWLDQSGIFWIFGGTSTAAGGLNDLWKFDPISEEWTWVSGPQYQSNTSGAYGTQGVPSVNNRPSALGFGSNCWTGNDGHLYLYGGYSSAILNSDNMWRYNISTNEWTWLRGSGPVGPTAAVSYGPLGVEDISYEPGGREEVKSGWVIGDKLWMFGGSRSTDHFGDIWSYNIATNNYAWQGGSQLPNSLGIYGTQGVSSPTNEPPARASYTKWINSNNDLFVFAGGSFLSSNTQNDVWKFDIITKEWTWVSGTNANNDAGVNNNPYCTPNINDIPRARLENQSAQTASSCIDAFWTFGGFNIALTEAHNDLWLYNTSNLEWTKVSGEASTGNIVPSDFGTKNVAAPTNMIPARGGHAIWSDQLGNVWIFGGLGRDAVVGFGFYNDLWKFEPDLDCLNTGIVGSAELSLPSKTSLCPGDTIHYPVPTNATITVSPNVNLWHDVPNNVIHFYGSGTTTYTVIGTGLDPNDPCFLNDTITFTITGYEKPTAAFDRLPETAIMGQGNFDLINQSQNATSYEWYYDGQQISTDLDINVSHAEPGIYCYTLVAIGECDLRDTAKHCVQVLADGSLVLPNAFSPNRDGLNDFFGPIVNGTLNIKEFLIFNRYGENIYKHSNGSQGWDGTYKGEPCESGVYYYMLAVSDAVGNERPYRGDVTLLR